MQKDKSYLPLTKEQVASNIFGNIPSRSVSLYQPINKNIQNTIPAMQNIDTNLSNVENPLFPGKMLSTGALEEINRLNKPTSISSQVAQPEIQNEEEQNNNRFLASLLGQGVAMFGAGIAGRDPMRTGEIISDQRTYQERLSQQQKIQKEQKDLADNLMNPTSKQSERKRLLYSRALGVDIPNDVSASDLEDPVVLNSLKQQSIQAQMAKMPKQVGVAQPKVEKQKERKLSQDERALLNNSALAYKALFDMEKAIKEGKSRSSILGDNEYTYAANRFVEGIGRMQSGGAIGPDEVENFKRLIPGRFDNEKISKQKIQDMKAELEARLKSINFDPKEILQSRTPSIDFKSEE